MRLLYQLLEPVREAGFAVVTDVLHVPQSGLADLGTGGVTAEPSGAGLVEALGALSAKLT
jgi:hypothetical protein